MNGDIEKTEPIDPEADKDEAPVGDVEPEVKEPETPAADDEEEA